MSNWNINWKHLLGTALVVAGGLVAYLTSSQGEASAQLLHLSGAVLGLAGTVIVLLQNSIKDPAAQVASDAAKKAAALKGVSALLMLASLVLLPGCLGSAPVVPVTAANTAQVSQCESTATQHNGFVIADFVFTGSGGVLGAAGALASDTQTKTDLAVSAAVAGGVAVLASSLVALSASNYANNDCSAVVGALPVVPIAPAPPPAASAGAGQ